MQYISRYYVQYFMSHSREKGISIKLDPFGCLLVRGEVSGKILVGEMMPLIQEAND